MNLLYKSSLGGGNFFSTPLLLALVSGFPLTLTPVTSLAAQPELKNDTVLPAIVIESTRLPQPDQEALRTIHVLTPDDAAVNYNSVAEALNGPVLALPSGNDGQPYTLFTRGASAAQTRFMLDGFRIGSASAGAANLNTLAPGHVGRIEILKGESSGLYGSDAMGGTISVFSRAPTFKGAQGALDGEIAYSPRYSGRTAHLGFSGHSKEVPVAIRIDASHAASAGYSLLSANHPFSAFATPADADNDGYERNNFSTQVRIQPSKKHAIDWIFHDHTINADVDFGDSSELRQSLYGFKGQHTLARGTDVSWKLGRSTDTNIYDDGFSKSRFQTHMDQSNVQVNQAIGKGQAFALVEQVIERLHGDTQFNNTQRTTRAIGVGYRLAPAPIGGEISLRHERTSPGHNHTSFSGRLGAQFHHNWLVSVGGGTSFRAPTFNDLYYPTPGWSLTPFSNPALRPEKSRNFEALLRYSSGNLKAQSTFFRSHYRDLIALNAAFTPFNLIRARIQGVELDTQYAYGAFKGRLHHTWQSTLNETNPLPLRLSRRPNSFGAASIEYLNEIITLGTEVQWVGQRWDDLNNTRNSPGFVLFNLKAEMPIKGSEKGWSTFIQANNLFNKQYEPILGYAAAGAQVLIGMRYRPITD